MTSMPTDREFIGQNGAIYEAVQRLTSSMTNKLLLSSLERGISNALQKAIDSLPQPTTLANSIQLQHSKFLPHRHNETKKQIRKSVVDKKTFFGTVSINSRTFEVSRKDIFKSSTFHEDLEEETRTWITVRPAPWIVSMGLKYGINAFITQSDTSWKHTLNTFRPVSDDAHIWKLIKWAIDEDDAQEIMKYMARGETSIWDTSPNGSTPLMVSNYCIISGRLLTHDDQAAATQHPPNLVLCKMLIAAGSNPNITDSLNWFALPSSLNLHTNLCRSPFSIHTNWHSKQSTDVLRLWIEAMDLDRDELWIGLRGLARAQAASSSFDFQNSPSVWLFNQLQLDPAMCGYDKLVFDLLSATNPRAFWWLYERVNERKNCPNSGFFQYLLDLFPDLIDVVEVEGGQTILFHTTMSGCCNSALQLVNAGAELHHYAQGHTITSKSLLSSHCFFKWQKILRTAGVDLERFAKLELEQGPLRRHGWETDTLLQVLKLKFAPVEVPSWKKFDCRCLYDCRCLHSEQDVVEVKWQIMLTQMRREDFRDLFQSFAGDLQPTSCDIGLFDGGDETSCGSEDESSDSDDDIESGANSRINKPKRAEDFNWLCEKCWRKLKNGDIGGIKSRNEVYRRSDEDEDEGSHFLLSI
jgi:hypothetical protein